ncbi:hypothetical protein CPB83DRAFT_911378, partial [Crepidotus variabilis]
LGFWAIFPLHPWFTNALVLGDHKGPVSWGQPLPHGQRELARSFSSTPFSYPHNSAKASAGCQPTGSVSTTFFLRVNTCFLVLH